MRRVLLGWHILWHPGHTVMGRNGRHLKCGTCFGRRKVETHPRRLSSSYPFPTTEGV